LYRNSPARVFFRILLTRGHTQAAPHQRHQEQKDREPSQA
jgi:hypothetical protein